MQDLTVLTIGQMVLWPKLPTTLQKGFSVSKQTKPSFFSCFRDVKYHQEQLRTVCVSWLLKHERDVDSYTELYFAKCLQWRIVEACLLFLGVFAVLECSSASVCDVTAFDSDPIFCDWQTPLKELNWRAGFFKPLPFGRSSSFCLQASLPFLSTTKNSRPGPGSCRKLVGVSFPVPFRIDSEDVSESLIGIERESSSMTYI